ncbi:hypothetical protein D9757_011834 [Collybiopsis confluens]|uniref:Chromo domain-containing protein n=1 Tax=Collybiopsis confluens TaxID=2823264 RepID=A0A8H5H0B2_9AGAR|nr:hypothetical protein D9757_011834 [Collybiopsis confluens]
MYQLLMERSVSRFEWEMIKFHFEDNNILTSGGLGPGPVAVQMNVSDTSTSLTGADLGDEIGRKQGALHNDPRDAVTINTLCTILLNIPKGAVGGSFLLIRYGLQIPFTDIWIIFLIFDGRSIHGGRNVHIHPTNVEKDTDYRYVDPKDLDFSFLQEGHHEELAFLLSAAVKRVALVAYIPHAAAYRTGNVALSPSVYFGNTGTVTAAEAKVKTYTGEGEYLLGSEKAIRTRFVREAVFAHVNMLHQLHLGVNYRSFQDAAKGIGGAEDIVPLEFDPLDPSQGNTILKYRRYFAYFDRLRTRQVLSIQQKTHFAHQDLLLKELKKSLRSELAPKPSNAPISIVPLVHPVGGQSSKDGPSNTSPGSSELVLVPIVAPTSPTTRSQNAALPVPKFTSSMRTPSHQSKAKTLELKRKGTKKPQKKLNGKRKRTADSESSDSRDSSDSPDGTDTEENGKVGKEYQVANETFQEYLVEQIVRHEYWQGAYWFLVKFEGYPLDEIHWYREVDLGNSKDKLSDYLTRVKLDICSFKSDDKFNYTLLENLFDSKLVKLERLRLQDLREKFLKSSISFKRATNHASWTALTDTHAKQNTLTHLLITNPLSSQSNLPFSSQSSLITACFERVEMSLKTLPTLTADDYVSYLQRIYTVWQKCRYLLILHDFVMYGLRDLTDILFQARKKGPELLLLHFGDLGRLYNDLALHVRGYQAEINRQKTQRSRKKAKTLVTDPSVSSPTSPESKFTFDPSSYSLPFSFKGHKTSLSVPYKSSQTEGQSEKEMFKTIMTSHFVLPHLKNSSLWIAEEKEEKFLLDQIIVRGSLLRTIIEYNDSEDICAFTGISCIFSSNVGSVFGRTSSTQNITSKIRTNPEQAVAHIRHWLESRVSHDFVLNASGLSRQVDWYMQEVACQQKIDEKVYLGDTDLSESKPPPRRGSKPNNFRSLTLDELMGTRKCISFGVIGLILAEALAEAQGLTYCCQPLRLFLQGNDPFNGKRYADGDRDQRNPCRQINQGAQLFSNHLPAFKLTTRHGLSNLLSWFSTGQGNLTSTFLHHITTMSCDSKFWSDSLHSLASKFISAGRHNERLLAASGEELDYKQESLLVKGALRLSNCRIYGTASNMHKLVPTARQDYRHSSPTISSSTALYRHLEKRFGSYWTNDVQDRWLKFIGHMQDQDPATYTGLRLTEMLYPT